MKQISTQFPNKNEHSNNYNDFYLYTIIRILILRTLEYHLLCVSVELFTNCVQVIETQLLQYTWLNALVLLQC